MEPEMNAHSTLAFTAWLLLQLLSAPHALFLPAPFEEEEGDLTPMRSILDDLAEPVFDAHAEIRATLLNFRLCTSLNVFDDDLGFWVKPRSTTWFSRFLLDEYNDSRWVQMFRFTKQAVFALADLLRPTIRKKDTGYSEMFAIGRSTVSSILRDVVHAINDTLIHELRWPTRDWLRQTQQKFNDLCGLPIVVGAIDGTHISISKPQHVPADYFYFKSSGYTLNCQAVVDSDKHFLDLYLGMPGSTNDARMLRRLSLYDLAGRNRLFDEQQSMQGFFPFLIGDQGYLLLPWLMVPHRRLGQLSVAEALFNKKLRRGRCVVENAFGILKQTFRELLTKLDLHVAFLPDVILACAILHNLLLGQSHGEVENLLKVLRAEGLRAEVPDESGAVEDGGEVIVEPPPIPSAVEKRIDLGLFLSMQRLHQRQ